MKNTEVSEKIKDILIVVLSIVLVVYLVLGINSIAHGDKFGFFNLRFYIVSSDVNNSETSSYDLINTTKIKKEKVKENNTIVYKKNNRTYVDRVVLDKYNNLYVESENINNQGSLQDIDVQGKVIGTAKGFGNLAIFLKSPLGVFNMVMIAVCVAIIIKKINDNNKSTEDRTEKDDMKAKSKEKNKWN